MLLFHFAGYGLKCYACFSTKSWDDCTPKEMTCPIGSDRCVKAHAEGAVQDVSGSVYNKGCTPSSACDQGSCKPFVPFDHSTIYECELSCCNVDLCNGAAAPKDGANILSNGARVPMVSAIMFLVCALVTFFC